MKEAFPRWKLFPREIEAGLQAEYGIDIGDWHEGRMSSRRLMTLTDGLSSDSWFKHAAAQFIEELKEEEELRPKRNVHSLIRAQLYGQKMEVTDANGA